MRQWRSEAGAAAHRAQEARPFLNVLNRITCACQKLSLRGSHSASSGSASLRAVLTPGLLLASCLLAGLTSALPSLDDDMASFGPSCRYPELGQPTQGSSALISDYLSVASGVGGAGRGSPSSDVYPVSLESGSQGPRASGKWAPNSALHSHTWIWSRVWRLWWEAASVTGLQGFLCVPTGRALGSGTTARALGLSCLSSLAGCPE